MNLDALKLIGDLAFVASALATLVFVVLYATRSAWRATSAGRTTLGFMAVIAAIMMSAIVFGTVWREGHDMERLVVRAVLYTLLFGGVVRYIVILLRVQRQERRRKAALRGGP